MSRLRLVLKTSTPLIFKVNFHSGLRLVIYAFGGMGFLFSSLIGQVAEQSEADNASAESVPTLTGVLDFWNLTDEERHRPWPVDMEWQVIYNDPYWKVVQIREGSVFEHVHIEGNFDARSGDIVRVRGKTTGNPSTLVIRLESWSLEGYQPLLASRIDLGETDHAEMANQLVELSGFVESQFLQGERHVNASLIVDGHRLTAYVLLRDGEPVPQWTGGWVKLKGVYSPKLHAQGDIIALEVWVPGSDAVEWLSPIALAPMFTQEVVSVGEVFDAADEHPTARVVGEFVGRDHKGRGLVRDEFGQARFRTAQEAFPEAGQMIEVAGRTKVSGVNLTLTKAIWIPARVEAQENSPSAQPARLHRMAASIAELPPSQMALGEPVELNAVVTWSSPDERVFYVEDASSGIGAVLADDGLEPPTMGDIVTLRGRTRLGRFAPQVEVASWALVTASGLPVAQQVTMDQVNSGSERGQFVRLTGFVFEAESTEKGVTLGLSTATGEVTVRLTTPAGGYMWLGSVVDVSGVCVALPGASAGLVEHEVLVGRPAQIQVLESGADDLFSLPTTAINDLGSYHVNLGSRFRVKIGGVVLWTDRDSRLILHDGSAMLRLQTRQPLNLQRGDRIEAVGFYGRENGYALLRESVWRRTGTADLPVPMRIAVSDLSAAAMSERRVRVEAEITERIATNRSVNLRLSDGRAVVSAAIDDSSRPPDLDTVLPLGARVEVIGIAMPTFRDLTGEPTAGILVTNWADVRVLQQPPWWTRERIMIVGFLILGFTVLAFGWVASLHRLVKNQTDELEERMGEARVLQEELQRTQRMESLGSMADGITRDFDSLLQRIHRQTSDVLRQEHLSRDGRNQLDQAQAAVLRAQDLIRRLASFSLTGRTKVQTTDLARLIEEETAAFDFGTLIKVVWQIPVGLPAIEIDPDQIRKVLHNLMQNAMQAMPMGGSLNIELAREVVGPAGSNQLIAIGEYLRVRMTDTGGGIEPGDLERVFDPYFSRRQGAKGLGLSVAYALVRQNGGRIDITSVEGSGTTVSFWLPIPTPDARKTST